MKSRWNVANCRAIFTYSGKETRKITRLFKDTNIKIAFQTKNTIQNILRHHTQTNKYNGNGVYQMKCMSCPLKCIGQTGISFNTRYKEHIRDINYNNSNSGYSSHILKTGHQYGSITDTTKVIKTPQKGKTSEYTGKVSHI
jgi:hypothetical protein